MRIFIIILIYISYGFISFGEIVFRDDFNNTNKDKHQQTKQRRKSNKGKHINV